VKNAFPFLSRTILLFLVAIGVLGAAAAGCCVAAMVIVWIAEGRLLAADRRILWWGAAWFAGACAFVFSAWRVANVFGRPDDSLRLTSSKSESAQPPWIGSALLFSLGAIFLWNFNGGPAVAKIPVLLGWLCLLMFAQHLHIFLHELGHFLAAWTLGFELRKMQVGVGTPVYCHSFGNGFRLEWRFWPSGGFMLATSPSPKNFRVRQFLYVAGGPFMDAVVLLIAYQLIFGGGLSPAPLDGPGAPFLLSFLGWLAMSFLGNLIPQTVSISGQPMWSDAQWLWMLCTKSRQRIVESLAQVHWEYARELFRFDEAQQFLDFEPCPGVPVNAALSREAFQSQSLRLRSRLLPPR